MGNRHWGQDGAGITQGTLRDTGIGSPKLPAGSREAPAHIPRKLHPVTFQPQEHNSLPKPAGDPPSDPTMHRAVCSCAGDAAGSTAVTPAQCSPGLYHAPGCSGQGWGAQQSSSAAHLPAGAAVPVSQRCHRGSALGNRTHTVLLNAQRGLCPLARAHTVPPWPIKRGCSSPHSSQGALPPAMPSHYVQLTDSTAHDSSSGALPKCAVR